MIFTVDIDSSSVRRLILTIKKALALGLKVIRAEVSPSGFGFHLWLEREGIGEIDAIIYRALLDDDPYRLRYSLKRFALGGSPDICFDWKAGKRSRKIRLDLEEIKRTSLRNIDRIVKKYEKRLKGLVKKSYLTIFEIEDGREEEIKKILNDIREKDGSFRFKIYPNLYKEGKTKKIAVIFSKDLDTAHKRGTWFMHKVGIKSYWVKEIERKI